jgi:hypothetical protein
LQQFKTTGGRVRFVNFLLFHNFLVRRLETVQNAHILPSLGKAEHSATNSFIPFFLERREIMSRYLVSASFAISLACVSSAFGAAGVSHTFTPADFSTTSTTNAWVNAGNLSTVGPAAPAATWVSARFGFSKTNGPTVLQTQFALGTVVSTGTSSTPAFTGGSGYFSALAQPTDLGSGNGRFFNNPLSTTYPGGSASLVMSVRNTGGSGVANYSNLSVTLFQQATPDVGGQLASTDPTFVRPNSFSGTGTPAAGFSSAQYDLIAFQVPTSGNWFISMISSGSANASIYTGNFDPANPTANLLRSGQTFYGTSTVPAVGGVTRNTLTGQGYDLNSGTIPGVNLTAGTTYFYAVSGSAATTPINWQIYSEGPGNASINLVPVPEPIALSMLAGASMLMMRRRK